MNKKSLASYLILTTIFLLLPSGVFGAAVQNTNPTGDQSPTLSGNTEVGELVWVNNVLTVRSRAAGTGTVRPLQLTTGATNPGVYIGANGNVGIGTTTITNALTVVGNIVASGSITGTGGITGNVTAAQVGGGATFGSTAGKGNYVFEGAATSNNVLKVDATNERVGIGTASPGTKLDISASGISASAFRGGALEIGSYSVNNNWIADNLYYDGSWKYRSNGEANQIYFGNGNTLSVNHSSSGSAGGLATLNTLMAISNTGNVGIGTTAPSGLLHLQTSGSTATLRIGAAGTAYGYFDIQRYDTGSGTGQTTFLDNYGASNFIFKNGNGVSPVVIYAGTTLANSSEHNYSNLYVDGNVGIGTTNPGAPLEVYKGDTTTNTYARFGNGGGSANVFIGKHPSSNGAGIIDIQTDGVTRTHIGSWSADVTYLMKDGGNVGIGKTNPATALDVNGTVTATAFSGPITGALGAPYVTPGTFGSTAGKGNYVFEAAANTNNVLKVDATNERVGIGTGSPTDKLHIMGGSGAGLTIQGLNAGVLFKNAAGTLSGQIYNDSANFALAFYSGSGAGTLGIYQNSSGNVGIGTTNPGATLDINSPGGSGLILRGAASGDAWLNFYGGTMNTAGIGGRFATDSGFLVFYTKDVGGGTSEKMRITSTGNIGIGTASPGAKLDINGDFKQGGITRTNVFNRTFPNGNLGDTVEIGTLTNNGVGMFVKIYIYNHSNNSIVSQEFEAQIPAYTTATTNWLEIPVTSMGTDYTGLPKFAVDIKHSANNTSAPIYLRLRMKTATGYNATVSIVLETNTTFTETSATGTGGVVDGYLASNSWQFPVSNGQAWTASTLGLFILNNGNIGINTVSPAYAFDVNGTGSFANPVIVGSPTASNHATTKSYVDSLITGGGTSGSLATLLVTGTTTLASTGGAVNIGGAGPSLKLNVTGQGQFSDTMSATKYYDYNDPTYYIDPANTGTSIKVAGAIQSDGSGINYMNGQLAVGTTNPGTYRLYVAGTSWFNNQMTINGNLTMNASSSITLSGGNIGSVGKLTVTTIDPLYNIDGKNYSTYASAIAGGVKEEYVGRGKLLKIKNLDLKIGAAEYQYIIDFSNIKRGSDLWVWYQAIDFSKENVEAMATAYGTIAKIGYSIEGKTITFFSDEPTEFSYRLVGKRIDHTNWPTYSKDQTEKASFIIKSK